MTSNLHPNGLRTITLTGLLVATWTLALAAELPTERPYPGISYHQETRQAPPMRLFVATVDLTRPGLKVRIAPGGDDPDGPGEWETTLMTPTRIAARDGFSLAINGDFFSIRQPADAVAWPSYRPGVWANVIGPAVSTGNTWSRSNKKRPCLIVRGKGRVSIEQIAKPPADAQEVIAGNVMLVAGGKVVPQRNQDKHPRTVVGLNDRGTRLVILVVDGRRPGVASGMSYDESAREMLRLGCKTAINLDGGGSSVMVLRDPETHRWRVLNQPSDGQERPVANVLGITLDKAG